jgi:hypothetical protein
MHLIKKIVIISAATILGIPILFCLSLYGYSLYCNLNPSHVNLKKDGFVKFFSFEMEKGKVLVEVYAKAGKKKNFKDFVIVRKGVLPFGIKAVSTIIPGFCYWMEAQPTVINRRTGENNNKSTGNFLF